MSNIDILEKEAAVITRYLIKRESSKKATELYIQAHRQHSIELEPREQYHWNKALRFPFLLQFIDARYALRKSPSSLRKKILVMFAVLESLPEYSSYFLPQERRNSFLILFLIAVKGVIRTSIGTLVLWIL